jgi:hypothetical protein
MSGPPGFFGEFLEFDKLGEAFRDRLLEVFAQ